MAVHPRDAGNLTAVPVDKFRVAIGQNRDAILSQWGFDAHGSEVYGFCSPINGKAKFSFHNSLAVLNADDPLIMERAPVTGSRVVTFGEAEGATLRLLHLHDRWPDPLTLTVRCRDEEFQVRSPLIGRQSVSVVLAALLAALEMGFDRDLLVERIAEYEPFMDRMSVHAAPDGRHFVLDAWKAPQRTMDTCLAFLEPVQAPRKTVVLGTLSDVRGNTRRRYEATARRALEVADRVLFVGEESARVRRTRDPDTQGRLFMFDRIRDAHDFLQEDPVPGEVIYVKGSRVDHLERLMHAVHAEIACWRYRCGKRFQGCSYCGLLLDRRIRDRRSVQHAAMVDGKAEASRLTAGSQARVSCAG